VQSDLQAQLDDTRYKLETSVESEKRTKKSLAALKLMVVDRHNQTQEEIEGLSHSLSRARAKQQQTRHQHVDSQHQTIETLKLENSRLRQRVSDSQSMSDMRSIDMSVTSMEEIEPHHTLDMGEHAAYEGAVGLPQSTSGRGLYGPSVDGGHENRQKPRKPAHRSAMSNQEKSSTDLSGSWARSTKASARKGEERSLIADAEKVMQRREALRARAARANAGAGCESSDGMRDAEN
jgi:hypothetical protein